MAPGSRWRSCCWRRSGRASAALSKCWTGSSGRTASSSWWRDPRTWRTCLTSSRRKVPYRRSWRGAFSARCWRPCGTATTAGWCTGTSRTKTSSSTSAPERWSSSTSDPEPYWKTPFTQTLMVSHQYDAFENGFIVIISLFFYWIFFLKSLLFEQPCAPIWSYDSCPRTPAGILGCVIPPPLHTHTHTHTQSNHIIHAEQHWLCFGAPHWREVAFLQLKVCKQSHMSAQPSLPHTHTACHTPWHLSPDNTLGNRPSW